MHGHQYKLSASNIYTLSPEIHNPAFEVGTTPQMGQPDPSSEKDGLRDNFTNAVYLYVIKNTFNQGLTFMNNRPSYHPT